MPALPMPMVLLLLVLGYAVVTVSLKVLAHRVHMRTRRHDLLVRIQSRRLSYELQLIERQRSLRADYEHSDVDPVEHWAAVAGKVTPGEPKQQQAA